LLILSCLMVFFAGPVHSAQVTIAWDPNTEPEVVGYRLHYGFASGQYASLSDVGSQTTCTLAGLEAGNTYFFAATAYDTQGNQSSYSQEVGFTVPSVGQDKSITYDFVSGWSLVSLPYQLASPSIASVLAPLAGKYSIVWAYRNGAWQYFTPQASPGGTLQTLDAGGAYWLRITSPAQLQISGAAASRNVNLTSGWNFVGYSAASAQSVSAVLASISGKYDVVWSYENGVWHYCDPTDPDGATLTQLQPGKGYWIKMREAAIWTLP
jgi:hypothetical protein